MGCSSYLGHLGKPFGEQHVQRYLAEFDFRYSNRSSRGVEDAERTELVIKGADGKRLTYVQSRGKRAA